MGIGRKEVHAERTDTLALLFYVAVYVAVHLEAKRTGMRGLPKPDLPRLGAVLKERGHQFLPLLVIVVVLFAGYSAPYAALCGICSVLPTALLRKTTRQYVSINVVVEALTNAAKDARAGSRERPSVVVATPP